MKILAREFNAVDFIAIIALFILSYMGLSAEESALFVYFLIFDGIYFIQRVADIFENN